MTRADKTGLGLFFLTVFLLFFSLLNFVRQKYIGGAVDLGLAIFAGNGIWVCSILSRLDKMEELIKGIKNIEASSTEAAHNLTPLVPPPGGHK